VNVYSYSGQFAGTVSPDGTITNAAGKRLGQVDAHGHIRNQYNSPSGRLQPWGRSVVWVGESGADLARIDSDGSIYRICHGSSPYLIGRVEGPDDLTLAGAAATLLVRSDIFHQGGPQAPQMVTPVGDKFEDRY
jgi:hypothetical protein